MEYESTPAIRSSSPSAKSISVLLGAIETMRVGDRSIVTWRPASSVIVRGNAGVQRQGESPRTSRRRVLPERMRQPHRQGREQQDHEGEQGDTASAHRPPPRVHERGAGDGQSSRETETLQTLHGHEVPPRRIVAAILGHVRRRHPRRGGHSGSRAVNGPVTAAGQRRLCTGLPPFQPHPFRRGPLLRIRLSAHATTGVLRSSKTRA